jgi:hypothetical protein
MNFCREWDGPEKILVKRTQKRSAEGAFPFGQSPLLEKGGDEVLVEFPENARAMVLKGYKISLEVFYSACLKLLLSYKHLLNFQNWEGDEL